MLGISRAVRLQQPAARVERGLEDLLLEGLVPDDLRDEQIGRLGQLELSRPARQERHAVLHAVGGEHALGDLRDVARLDCIDVPGPRAGRRHGEDTAPGADVEHHVSRSHRLGERGEIVAGPAVVVEHAAVLHGVRPAARRAARRVGLHERALLDQHVDDAHRRQEVR